MSRRIWKEGAPNAPRALRHNVARSVEDVDPGRKLSLIGRAAKRRKNPPTVRKDN
jgi:hypothetical protein